MLDVLGVRQDWYRLSTVSLTTAVSKLIDAQSLMVGLFSLIREIKPASFLLIGLD